MASKPALIIASPFAIETTRKEPFSPRRIIIAFTARFRKDSALFSFENRKAPFTALLFLLFMSFAFNGLSRHPGRRFANRKPQQNVGTQRLGTLNGVRDVLYAGGEFSLFPCNSGVVACNSGRNRCNRTPKYRARPCGNAS